MPVLLGAGLVALAPAPVGYARQSFASLLVVA